MAEESVTVELELAEMVWRTFQREADKRGITVAEYIRFQLGEWANGLQQMAIPTNAIRLGTINLGETPPDMKEKQDRVEQLNKLSYGLQQLLITQGPYKCPHCSKPLTPKGVISGKCEQCGNEIFPKQDKTDDWKIPGMKEG
jgi:DNA-directed RNA polymerase subunit RPC12/RpoP